MFESVDIPAHLHPMKARYHARLTGIGLHDILKDEARQQHQRCRRQSRRLREGFFQDENAWAGARHGLKRSHRLLKSNFWHQLGHYPQKDPKPLDGSYLRHRSLPCLQIEQRLPGYLANDSHELGFRNK